MSHRADPQFLSELKQYGTVNVESCFNCGNCTAVCPLSTEDSNFPRRMIRYAQLGIREELSNSKELWLCHYCGECTATCPRQADPGEFMAAARRFAIAKYDHLGLARWLYTSTAFSISFLTSLALLLALFIYSYHGPMPTDALRLFEFLPYEFIHTWGMAVGIVIAIIALSGISTMALNLGKNIIPPAGSRMNWIRALWKTLAIDVLGQRQYRNDCEESGSEQPWYIQKWFVHGATMWGFLGLFLATALDYLLELVGAKATGTWVPLWYPVRLLGTLAGISLIYGTTMAIMRRLRKVDNASKHSTTSDWTFLILLWLGGMTGFVLELALYLPEPHAWSYWMLLAHLVIVAELLILVTCTKFAHAIYRTVALYFYALKPLPESEPAGAGAHN